MRWHVEKGDVFGWTPYYQAFYMAIQVCLVRYTTINSSTSPKSNVNIFNYMKNDRVFVILVTVVFSVSPQLGDVGPMFQYLVTSFQLTEVDSLPDSYLIYLQ